MFRNTLAVLAVSALLAGPSVAENVTIERLAPKNSVVIIGVKNIERACDRFKQTGLWRLWKSDEMQTLRAEYEEDMSRQVFDEMGVGNLEELLQELGVERDSLAPPTGAAGAAWFPVVDPEIGSTSAGALAFVDYGENADKAQTFIDAMMARARDKHDFNYEEREINGHTVYTLDMEQLRGEEIAFDDVDMGGGGMNGMIPGPADFFSGYEKVHLTRAGTAFLMGSHLESIGDALEMFDNDDTTGLGDREDFQGVMSQLGSTDAFAVLTTRGLMEMVASGDQMGMAMMVQPMLKSVFGRVDGMGMGMQIDGSSNVMQLTSSVLMPEGKTGLPALFDTESPIREVPSFVGPDTVNYGTFSFEFDGVIDLARSIFDSNPMLQMQIGAEGFAAFEQTAAPLLASLDREVHTLTTLTRPIQMDSLGTLYAIRSDQPNEFENAFGALAPQMGLEPRSFMGNRIYSFSDAMAGQMGMVGGGFDDISVGIGGGFVFAGTTQTVEQALRSIAEPGIRTLGDNHEFRRAVRSLPGDSAVGWGYTALVDSIEGPLKVTNMQTQQMMREWAENDPEMAGLEDEMDHPFIEGMDYDLLRRHIGPMVWDLRSTDDGFVGRYFLLDSASPDTAVGD